MTINIVCRCDKVCKNPRDLKIHQTNMGCFRKQVVQRAVPESFTLTGELEDELGPVIPYNA